MLPAHRLDDLAHGGQRSIGPLPDGDNCRLSFDPGSSGVAIAAAEAFTAHLSPSRPTSQILGSEILLTCLRTPPGSEWAYRLAPADVLLVTEDVYLGDEGQSARPPAPAGTRGRRGRPDPESMPPQPDDEAFAAFEEGLIITYGWMRTCRLPAWGREADPRAEREYPLVKNFPEDAILRVQNLNQWEGQAYGDLL